MAGSATKTLIRAIRLELLDRGLTQPQLADEMEISVPTLSRILNGQFPGRFVAYKVASRYGLKPSAVWPDRVDAA